MAVNTTLVWSNIVAALGAAIVSTLLTAWYFKGAAKPAVSELGVPGSVLGVGTLAVETITYIPHILLLFGVLADIFTMQGVYSIPSLIGLLSIPANYVFKFFWAGLLGLFNSMYELYNIKPASSPFTAGPSISEAVESLTSTKNPMTTEAKPAPAPAPKTEDEGVFSMLNPMFTGKTSKKSAPVNPKVKRSLEEFGPKMDGGTIKDYDGCDVQGFSAISSPFAPQTLVVTATVFFYYIFDIVANRGWVDATSSIVVFAILYFAETFIIDDCGVATSKWIRSILAFLEGLLFGGSAYGVVQAYYPSKLPSTALPVFPRKTASDLKKNADGTYQDEQGTKWNILPSGLAVPDVSTGAGMAAAIGGPAVQVGCPTK